MSRDDLHDDIDQLFARLTPVAPPPDLVARAMAAATARAARRERWLLALGYGVVLPAIALQSFAIGRMLVLSGAGVLLGLALFEPSVVVTAPADFALALSATVSWQLLGGLLLAWIALLWCSRQLGAGGR